MKIALTSSLQGKLYSLRTVRTTWKMKERLQIFLISIDLPWASKAPSAVTSKRPLSSFAKLAWLDGALFTRAENTKIGACDSFGNHKTLCLPDLHAHCCEIFTLRRYIAHVRSHRLHQSHRPTSVASTMRPIWPIRYDLFWSTLQHSASMLSFELNIWVILTATNIKFTIFSLLIFKKYSKEGKVHCKL